MDRIYTALCHLRVPLQYGEYDLHELVMSNLLQYHIPYQHEVRLAPRCRIDLLCGSIGIEIKRGKPEHGKLVAQLQKYASCPQITGLILISERSVSLPDTIMGKPVQTICLNRLWGIAL